MSIYYPTSSAISGENHPSFSIIGMLGNRREEILSPAEHQLASTFEYDITEDVVKLSADYYYSE